MIYHAGDRIEVDHVPGTVKALAKDQFTVDYLYYDVLMDSGRERRVKSIQMWPLSKQTEFRYLKRQKNLSPEEQAYMKQLEEELTQHRRVVEVKRNPELVRKEREEQEALRRKAARKYGLRSLKGGEKNEH